jgi:molecular chaperone DnaK
MAKDNKTLGRFELEGIRPAPRGVPQIEVSFDIDANGILKVSARDIDTGAEQSISITNTGGLSPTEIQRAIMEEEVYREEDMMRKEIANMRNISASLIRSVEEILQENGPIVITESLRKPTQENIARLKEILEQDEIDLEEIRERHKALQQSLVDVTRAVESYSQVQRVN